VVYWENCQRSIVISLQLHTTAAHFEPGTEAMPGKKWAWTGKIGMQ
jgi:hypothetical protein